MAKRHPDGCPCINCHLDRVRGPEPSTPETPCVCGAQHCGNRNRTHFSRLRKPNRIVRAQVFIWPGRGFWTWCPVINGEANDVGQVMGHYDSLERAFAHAWRWTRGNYGAEPGVSR